jgi:hypothetical protein
MNESARTKECIDNPIAYVRVHGRCTFLLVLLSGSFILQPNER